MERFLDFVLRHFIEFPDELLILKEETPERLTFRLQLRKSDIGKVIGKHGQTISSIRNLLAAAAAKHGKKAFLEIIEEQPRQHSRNPAAP